MSLEDRLAVLREAQPPTQVCTAGAQSPEQHCALLVHAWRLCKQDAAWAGVGAIIEVTKGKAMAAAMPMRRMATRREGCSVGASRSTSRCASPNWSRASCTMDSST